MFWQCLCFGFSTYSALLLPSVQLVNFEEISLRRSRLQLLQMQDYKRVLGECTTMSSQAVSNETSVWKQFFYE